MAIKSILVPVGGGGGESDLALALLLGRRLGARVTALHAVPDSGESIPYLTVGLTGRAVDQLIDEIENELAAETVRANTAFAAACAAAGVTPVEGFAGPGFAARFLSATGNVEQLLVAQGRAHDLIVMSCPGETDPARLPVLQAALMESGRPVLFAPPTLPESFASRVVLAWNGSIEAARALSLAAELAADAERIVAVSIGEPGRAEMGPGPETAVDYLAAHGLAAETRVLAPSSKPIAEALLRAIDDERADLLVMGAYSHSRLRETILGGVTRDILANLELPVLMVH